MKTRFVAFVRRNTAILLTIALWAALWFKLSELERSIDPDVCTASDIEDARNSIESAVDDARYQIESAVDGAEARIRSAIIIWAR